MEKDCLTRKLNREDAMDRNRRRKQIKDWLMTAIVMDAYHH